MEQINDTIHTLIEKSFAAQIRETQEVLRIKSTLDESQSTLEHPFGPNVTHALNDFLERGEKLGFKVKNIDNYAGYVEMGSTGTLVGILAHLDVVPEGNEKDWKYPPYAAVIEDSKLFGRGSIDDKGPAVAVLYAMKALRDSGTDLHHRFRLILGLDEESGSRCIKHYNEVEEQPEFSFSPDAEFPVVNAEKGILRLIVTKNVPADMSQGKISLLSVHGGDRFNVVPNEASAVIQCPESGAAEIKNACANFDIEIINHSNTLEIAAKGTSAHAMEPHKGDNAVQKLLKALLLIDLSPNAKEFVQTLYNMAGTGYSGEGLGIQTADADSGSLTCNLAAIDMDSSNTDLSASIKLDIRYPVTANYDRLIGKLNDCISKNKAEVTIHTHKKPLYLPASHKVVQTLLDAYESVTGDRPAPVSMGGGTYCRFMPNAVSAGPLFPGQEELAHQANENVSLDDLLKSTHIYGEIIARLNSL